MPTGFGGAGPGISILVGVARGIADDEKRRREIEQEAINRRLKEAQITQMAENVRLQEEREARYQAQEANRVAEVEYARNEAEAENLRNEEQMQLAIGSMTQQIMAENPDMDPDLAGYVAYNAVHKLVPYRSPEEAEAGATAKWQYDVFKEEASEQEKDRIIQDPEFWGFIKSAPDIGSVFEEAYEKGYDRNAASELWADLNRGKEDEPEEWEEITATVRADIDRDATVSAQSVLNDVDRKMAAQNSATNGEYFKRLNEDGTFSQARASLAMTFLSQEVDFILNNPRARWDDKWRARRALVQLNRLVVGAEKDELEADDEYVDWDLQGRSGG